MKLYLDNGQEALAMQQCRTSAAASGQASWAWASLGRACMAQEQLTEAAAHLQQALQVRKSSWYRLSWRSLTCAMASVLYEGLPDS